MYFHKLFKRKNLKILLQNLLPICPLELQTNVHKSFWRIVISQSKTMNILQQKP